MRRTSRTALCLLAGLRAAALATSADPATRRVLLVRHGETNFTKVHRIQGTLESQLTEAGRAQARELGSWLAASYSGAIDRVVCSPKARTRATLDEIEASFAATGAVPPPERELRWDLRELELTDWEGRYRKDIASHDADSYHSWKSRPAEFVFPSGHAPLPALWARTETEWAHLRESTPAGTTTLVVAHGAFNRAFLARVFGLPIEAFVDEGGRFDFVNCECAEIEWVEPPVTGGDAAAPPMLRWRRRHPRESAWSTPADEQAAGAWWSAGEDAREL